MARVYQCWDDKLEVWCAVKVMTESTMPDPEARLRFAREARSLARLAHPNIVWLYDLEIDRQTPYMVMEYLRGGSLHSRLKAGVLHPALACRVAADTASALDAAHRKGIIHRDVKPQNLLLDEWGTVKVADFGVARIAVAASVTVDGMALGTWSFMAPEQLDDPHHIDARVDVYALGATLFKMLARRKPTVLRSESRREAALEHVPEVLRPVVRRATALAPADRFASARELEQAPGSARRRRPRRGDRHAPDDAPTADHSGPRAAGNAVSPRTLRTRTPSREAP
jgi:serine/threonine-protein kinase